MAPQNFLRKILTARTTEELLSVSASVGLLQNGKINLAGEKVVLKYDGIDLSVFRFNGADLTGSRFTNCSGIGAVFDDCRLDRVSFISEGAQKTSMERAAFNRVSMKGAYFGPRTLDLSSTCFAGADIQQTKFILGYLPLVDFSNSRLKDVHFRDARLEEARFLGAFLERVNLEKAKMRGADFTNATFHEMEHWGKPDFTGAVVPDALLFQYAVITNPVDSIDEAIKSSEFSDYERSQLLLFRERVATFASDAPEAMLIATEYEDLISFDLFVKIMKRINGK